MIFHSITHLKEELGEELKAGTLVMTSGCFDIFHFGYVHLLELCAKLGDMVIVIVNNDVAVSEMKGIRRPVQPAAFRAGVVEACGYVDHVLVWSSSDVIPVLEALRPHYWVKGRRKYEDVLEAELVCAYGGDVVCYWPYIDVSTSRVIESIVEDAQMEEVSTGMDAGNIVEIDEEKWRVKRYGEGEDRHFDIQLTPGELREVAADLSAKINLAHGGRWVQVDRFGYTFGVDIEVVKEVDGEEDDHEEGTGEDDIPLT